MGEEDAIQTFRENSIQMKEHQIEAMKWLVNVEKNLHPYGGILADDMGLGKTLESLSIVLANRVPNTLIIVPASLVDQWILEVNRFASKLEINVDYPGGDITITSYHKASQRQSIREFQWDRIILDEGHYIRNFDTLTHSRLKKIEAKHKWIMSGTPIQNKLSDLKTLLRFVGFDLEVHRDDLEQIEKAVETNLLRRTKQGLKLSMPELKIFKYYLDFSTIAEKLAYENGDYGLGSKYEDFDACYLLKLLRQRQYTLLPQMVNDSMKKTQIKSWVPNTKLDAVIKTIKKYNHLEKPIVFCHFKKEMDYLITHLSNEGFRVAMINGDIPMSMRRQIIKEHEQIDILLIQLQSGSVGLNLQMFNGVYFTAPHWNPTHERQAVCRAYRLGQTKTVYVRRFAFRDTIEQVIIRRQKLKKEIAQKFNLL